MLFKSNDNDNDSDTPDPSNSGNQRSGDNDNNGPHDRPDRDSPSRESNNLKDTNTKGNTLKERATSKQDKNIEVKDIEKEQNKIEKKLDELKKEIDRKLNEIAENVKKFGERALPAACEQMEKMAGNLPNSTMKDMLNGASKMCENFVDLLNDDGGQIEFDKFHHCMGNCQAAEFGPGGAAIAEAIGNLWEKINPSEDSPNDLKANAFGRQLGLKNYVNKDMGLQGTRCYDGCSSYRKSLER